MKISVTLQVGFLYLCVSPQVTSYQPSGDYSISTDYFFIRRTDNHNKHFNKKHSIRFTDKFNDIPHDNDFAAFNEIDTHSIVKGDKWFLKSHPGVNHPLLERPRVPAMVHQTPAPSRIHAQLLPTPAQTPSAAKSIDYHARGPQIMPPPNMFPTTVRYSPFEDRANSFGNDFVPIHPLVQRTLPLPSLPQTPVPVPILRSSGKALNQNVLQRRRLALLPPPSPDPKNPPPIYRHHTEIKQLKSGKSLQKSMPAHHVDERKVEKHKEKYSPLYPSRGPLAGGKVLRKIDKSKISKKNKKKKSSRKVCL